MIAEKKYRRNRIKPGFPVKVQGNPVLHFQKMHNAVVKFYTCKMADTSGDNLIKCEAKNSFGLVTHAYGSNIKTAFRNMVAMYNLKYIV